MAKQVVELGMLLAKLQSTFGTMETTLSTVDFVETAKPPSLSFEPTVSPVELVGAGFSQNQSVIGALESSLQASFPLRTGGAEGAFGEWYKFLQASGWKVTVSDHTATCVPTSKQSEWKDMTLGAYSGNSGTTSSLLYKIGNALFGFKITLDFEKAIATIDFTGKGAPAGAPTIATQPAATKAGGVVQSLKGSAFSFFNETYFIPLQATFECTNEVNVTLDHSNTPGGKGMSLFTKSRITWSATGYRDSGVALETSLLAGTIGSIVFSNGTAPNAITIDTAKAQITKIDYADSNGVETISASGICIDNDLEITIDTTVTV